MADHSTQPGLTLLAVNGFISTRRKHTSRRVIELPLPYPLLRAQRKYASDGGAAVLSEALTNVLESEGARSIVRTTVLDQATVLEQTRLREHANRHWDCDPTRSLNPFASETAVPPKMRLPNSGSFDGLDAALPKSPFVAELEDVTVLGPAGLGITDRSEILKNTVSPDGHSDSRIEKVLARSIRHNGYRRTKAVVRSPSATTDRRIRVAASLVPVWTNYYHWTLECLPKVLGLETYRKRTGLDPTVLLPPDPPSWMLDSLKLVGVDGTALRPIEPGTTRVDRFVAPSYPTPSRTECFWLRNRAHRATGVESESAADYPDRIYVTRRNANVRRVKNEAKVLDTLNEFDVEPYALEELSISEQIKLFATVDLVIAPHGAGLANLVYGSAPTVLELFGDKEKTTFYRLSKLMGIEYHALFCDHEQKDLVVDPDRLRATVRNVIDGTKPPILEPEDDT